VVPPVPQLAAPLPNDIFYPFTLGSGAVRTNQGAWPIAHIIIFPFIGLLTTYLLFFLI